MIKRQKFLKKIHNSLQVHPICALLGPRQCGKTTLAKEYANRTSKKFSFFNLDDPMDWVKFENPSLTLEALDGLIIIDAIQKKPEILNYLHALIERYPARQYIILGIMSQNTLYQASESLIGRMGCIEITPFQLEEVIDWLKLWGRGGFPRSYLAADMDLSLEWRNHYMTMLIERDIRNSGFQVSPQEMRRFWTMLAYSHGDIINYSDLGRSLNVSDNTIRRYVQLLEESFMVRCLQPWSENNLKKRQVKSPRVYVRDSGLLHCLLNIHNSEMNSYPKIGASWSSFALEQVIHHHDALDEECSFWTTAGKTKIDLLIHKGNERLAFEFQYSDNPKVTRTMRTAMRDLKLDKLTVIFPMDAELSLERDIHAVGLKNYLSLQEEEEQNPRSVAL